MKEMKSLTGIVFNIQRFTVHDGPGIRTEVFLKGCPFRCLWCDNPESFHLRQEVGVYPKRCVSIAKCGSCVAVCPLGNDSIFVEKDSGVISGINKEFCTNCLKCVEVCPSNALVSWGSEMTVENVIDIVLRDREFYDNSSGGITISGGEPLVQWMFTLELLKESKRVGIHTCLESTLHDKWDLVKKLLQYTDFLITDIKCMDTTKHIEYTGVSNILILENIKKVAELGKPYIIRIPIIPDHNDSNENIKKTAQFINNELGNTVKQVQLLPFHEYGKIKYSTLGLKYPLENYKWPERSIQKKKITHLVEVMRLHGIPAVLGNTTKVK